MKFASNSHHGQSAADVPTHLCRELMAALGKLKGRLLERYTQASPGRENLIRQAVAEAEELAWQTPFPHLFLPDFAEARVAEIVAMHEPAFAEAA
jgi:hypothetical protein